MYRSACFIIASVLQIVVHAQHYYDTYSPANGLVDARVNRVIQDDNGSLLFLTRDGISIYDGQRMQNHSRFLGESIGIVNDALPREDGSFSLACFNGQWLNWDRGSLKPDSLLSSKKISEVSRIFQLGGQEYLVYANAGLYRYSKGKLQPLQLRGSIIIPFTKTIDKLAVSGNHLLLNFSQYNRELLYLYDLADNRLLDSLSVGTLIDITADDEGNLYVTQNPGIRQFAAADIRKGKLLAQPAWFQQLVPVGFKTEYIFFDRQKHPWLINSVQGCYRLDPAFQMATLYSTDKGLLTGVRSMYQDKEENYWFIAPGKGVQKLVKSNYEPVLFKGMNEKQQFLACSRSEDNTILITTDKQYAVQKNGKWLWESLAIKTFPPGPGFYWQNKFWIYSKENEVTDLNKRTYKLDPDKGQRIVQHQPSNYIGFDEQGNVLLSGNRFTLVRKDLSSASFTLPYFADNIVAAGNNKYYAFCRSEDVVTLSLENNRLIQKNNFRLTNMAPRYTIHWNKDTFLIASRTRGIQWVIVNENAVLPIASIRREHGLSNDFVEVVHKLNDHQLAAGTASGLDIISWLPGDTLVENISARVGLFEPIQELVVDEQDNIFVRTEDYKIFRYSVSKSSGPGYQPKAWFSQVKVNDRTTDTNTYRFAHNHNNFYFEVSSPSFIDSRQILFVFQLTGASYQMTQKTNKADFSVNNLPPGSYSLKVSVRYPQRAYIDNQLSYHFTIRPPFWKTWWFIGILVLLVIGSVVRVTRGYYRRRLQKRENELHKQQAIEKERTRIATDMHDDFGASLSRIKFLSEKMQLYKTERSTTQADLEKISAYSDEMAEKMNEIVWALNQRYDSCADLVSFCRSYASEFLQDKSIDLQFRSGEVPDKKIQGEVRRNIFLVMKEALHNMVKHSGATVATISFTFDDRIRLVIADNGKGFDNAHIRPFANGLENMRKRMADIDGQIEIMGDKGAMISLSVPL
ncbi:MAG: ATP-binding protein [Bacteroidota bacterium]